MFSRSLCIAVTLLLVGCLWPQEQVEETKRRGNLIRAALKQYYERLGSYPSQLDELVPGEISAIPQPTVGKKQWEYRTWPEGGIRQFYRLTAVTGWFRGDADLWADSKHEDWWYDTK